MTELAEEFAFWAGKSLELVEKATGPHAILRVSAKFLFIWLPGAGNPLSPGREVLLRPRLATLHPHAGVLTPLRTLAAVILFAPVVAGAQPAPAVDVAPPVDQVDVARRVSPSQVRVRDAELEVAGAAAVVVVFGEVVAPVRVSFFDPVRRVYVGAGHE